MSMKPSISVLIGATVASDGLSNRFKGVQLITVYAMIATFFCTGLVPVEKYPDWVQPFVRYQPMSAAVDAMRGLSVGGPVLMPMLGTLAWSAGILAACLWPIMVGYRRASTSR